MPVQLLFLYVCVMLQVEYATATNYISSTTHLEDIATCTTEHEANVIMILYSLVQVHILLINSIVG